MSTTPEGLELLIDDDREFLQELGLPFEIHSENVNGANEVHVILKGFPFPEAYSPDQADMLFRLPPDYNVSMNDMFWVSPPVNLRSGATPLACTMTGNYCNRQWQQWSRHYRGWRAYTDNLRSFYTAIKNELEKGK